MHPDQHLSEEEKAACAADADKFRQAQPHLRSCAACSDDVSAYRVIIRSARDAETWWLNAQMEREHTQTEGRTLEERFALEDKDANRVLEPLVADALQFANANISRKRRYRHGGFVRGLCALALDKCYSDPKYALVLASQAQVIASLLPDNTYPARLVHKTRGDAWKDYSTVCRYLADFTEALRALDRAKGEYEHLIDDGACLAGVLHARAQILCKQKKNAEALPLARRAAKEYENRQMTRQYLEASETVAVIIHDLGDVKTARRTYEDIYASDDLDDASMKARAAKALGIIARDADDFGAASMYFLTALQLYEGLGHHVMVIRMQWSIARLALRAGNLRDAAVRFSQVSDALRAKGLLMDVADVDLDRAETHLLLQEPGEAAAICEELVITYLQMNALGGALTAVSFLKEAAVMQQLRPQHVQYVRKFLAELARQPNLVFALPPKI